MFLSSFSEWHEDWRMCSVLLRDHWVLLMERVGWKVQLSVVLYHENVCLEPGVLGLCWSSAALRYHQKRSSAFSDDVMENGWGGGEDLFFLVASKKQEVIGGKQWGLVGVGEKKAEDWAQPVKLHWASLWLTSHWFRFCLIKQNFPRVEQMQAFKHCSVSAPETWTECVPSFLPPEITHSHKTCKVFPSPPEDAPVPF